MNPNEPIFHSPPSLSWENLRNHVHLLLVHPEESQNVGSVARAAANMGILTPLRLLAPRGIVNPRAIALAKHARPRLEQALFFENFPEAIAFNSSQRVLRVAATARVGSAHRPHPLSVREAVPRLMEKLKQNEIDEILFVFGRESDGLTNEEVAHCDWIVTIPSSDEYRSLNLAQAVLIFCYEVHCALSGKPTEDFLANSNSQKERIVTHLLQLAEEVGFILPGDPHKMRPRLEKLFEKIPSYVEEARTLHGFLDQIRRSVKEGRPDIKGRYKQFFLENRG